MLRRMEGSEVEWAVSGRSGYDASLAGGKRGTGGWERRSRGRRCHSISKRRRGRAGPPAEAALLALPMDFTIIPHTF